MDTTLELRRRRVFAGISMITAPLALGVAYLVAPQLRSDTAEQLTAFAAAPGRLEAGLVIGLAGAALSVFAALGLAHLLREDQPWFGQLGAVLAVTGIVLYSATQGALVAASEAAQLDVAAATAVWDASTSNPVLVVAVAGLVAAGIGFLVLAAGLVMARTAPLWSSVGLALGTVVLIVGILATSTVWAVIGAAIVFIGLAPLGYEIVAEPDEAWEHPVHFQGMRAMPG